MPVRLLSSSILKWPDWAQIDKAVHDWVAEQARLHPELCRFGYFGSYARGDWGVGSDLDLIAIVETSKDPFERRVLAWEIERLPVPAELLVYTVEEWQRIQKEGERFSRTLSEETVWVFPE